jgi:membrane-associated phospholipid phosphatase
MYTGRPLVDQFRSKIRGRFSCIAICFTLTLTAWSSASADDSGDGEQWNPRFTHFTTLQYGLTMVGFTGVLASGAILPASNDVHWRGNIMFDSGARSFFAASSESGRRNASTVSDYMALGLVMAPFAVDAFLAAGAVHGNYDVAFQMALIGAQSLMVANLVTNLTKRLVGRARPDIGNCKAGTEMACATENESFISGHTSAAFAGAGLMCANQQNLKLYGSGAAGWIACGAALGAATTVGTLRMVADRHHLSDVLAGAAVGLAAGYLLPNLTNFDFGNNGRSHGSLMPLAGAGTVGMQYAGAF